MKQFLNRLINALALMLFTLMISTGSILKWILPPGSGRIESLTRGGIGGNKSILTLLGLTRHDWGRSHFYIAAAFLVLLIIHLALHWNWICATAWGTKKSPQPVLRRLVTVGIALFVIILLILPWVIEKQEMTKAQVVAERYR